jgi:hypothetical protein
MSKLVEVAGGMPGLFHLAAGSRVKKHFRWQI